MRIFSTKPFFDRQLAKMDGSIRPLIRKRMIKVVEKPELGKPLQSPMQHYFSERIEKYLIIYTYTSDHVTFVCFDHRDRVFRHPFELES